MPLMSIGRELKNFGPSLKEKRTEKCQAFDLVCKGVCMPNDISNIYILDLFRVSKNIFKFSSC